MAAVEVIGHRATQEYLAGAIESDSLAHAYLFSGPSLVGKGILALWFAQAVNCLEPRARHYPCGECHICRKIEKRSQIDMKEIFPEGRADEIGPVRKVSAAGGDGEAADEPARKKAKGEIKIEPIRDLIRESHLLPVEAKRKFYLLHQAERLNDASCNALLKTLEEPSPTVVIVLVTANPDALPPTIVSRCQRVRLHPVPDGEIAGLLSTRHGLAPSEAARLSYLAGGCPGRALHFLRDRSILELREKTLKVLVNLPAASIIQALDDAATLESISKETGSREKEERVLDVLLSWYRDLAGVKEGLPAQYLVNRDREALLREKSQLFTRLSLNRGLAAILESRKGLERNVNTRLMFQNLLIQLMEER